MIQYPLVFNVEGAASEGIQTQWQTKAQSIETSIGVAVPPEFDGPGGGYSPEDLYAFALTNCFIATFKVIAEKSKLSFQNLKAQGALSVDRNEAGAPWMKAFHLRVQLSGVTDAERARRLLEKTSQLCMILNSVKTEKTFEFLVET